MLTPAPRALEKSFQNTLLKLITPSRHDQAPDEQKESGDEDHKCEANHRNKDEPDDRAEWLMISLTASISTRMGFSGGTGITTDRKIPRLSFNGGQQEYHIVLKEKGYKPLPFWLMQVPKEIVPDHSNIFTEPFENMLSTLLHWSMTEVEPTKLKCDRPK